MRIADVLRNKGAAVVTINPDATVKELLAGLKRWPVTVSYFDKASKSGEQAPVYAIKFELYENGVSRALVLDYNDFAINGIATSVDGSKIYVTFTTPTKLQGGLLEVPVFGGCSVHSMNRFIPRSGHADKRNRCHFRW